nr:bifunctional glycosyltransferase family 2/GtrA family protein [uncultured Lachnoclostridium sp.]
MEKVVIIPALDPDERLREIVDRNWDLENQIILVDDGSDEGYDRFFWELGDKCIVLHHEENRGKGEAIKTALRYIRDELWDCRVIGIMDADGQHLPDDMEKLLFKAGCHPHALVIGARTIDSSVPWRSRVGNQVTAKMFRLLTGVTVSDTQTGLRAFSSRLLDFMLEVEGSRYEYEMGVLMACARRKVEIIEVPVETIYHDKDNSCSHFRHVRDSLRIYGQLLKFSAISFSSFLVDYALFAFFTLLLPPAAVSVTAANVSARVLSAGYNYSMNCRFVFHERRSGRTALDYLALASLILLLNSIVLQALLLFARMPVYPAKILTECVLFVFSYAVQKKIIFRRKKRGRDGSRAGEKIREICKESGEYL